MIGEFSRAALHYPIVFAGADLAPVAVCGMPGTGNLFVDADGAYQPDAYIPAVLRRYPFTLAEPEDGGEALIVCVDVGSDRVSATPDVAFFESGAPTAVTQEAVELLTGFEQERQETRAFVTLLKTLGLLRAKVASGAMSDCGSAVIASYQGVDEDRLAAVLLEAAGATAARRPIAAGYAQLLSENNWARLIARIPA